MSDKQQLVLHFGKGEKGKFTAIDLLEGIEAPKEVINAIGNGLTIGGLNIGVPEKVIGIPEETTSLEIVAPGEEPITLKTVCDLPERTQEEEAEIQARRNPESEAEKVEGEVVSE